MKLKRRLQLYAYIESGITGDVGFLQVEYLFRLIVKEAKSDPRDLHLISQYPANLFDQKHLNYFYRLLVVIIEGLPITRQEKLLPLNEEFQEVAANEP